MTDSGTDTTTEIFAHTPKALRREVGSRLRARREELGLKRSEVAAAAGYGNLSKGSRRIADREAGKHTRLVNEDGYWSALRLDPAEVLPDLARAEGIEDRIQGLGQDVIAAERSLLQAHAGLIRTRATDLSQDPVLSHVRSPAIALRILWMGGGSLSLGTLATAWAAGSLVADTEAHGPVYLFEGAGSALSGAGRCTGVDQNGTLQQVRQSPTRFLGRNGPRPGREQAPPSPLCLADALATLGVRVPEIRFHLLDADARPEASPVAIYDPNTRHFHTTAGDTTPVDAQAPTDATVQPIHGGVSVSGGRPRPLQLAPGWHLGAFEADQLEHACGLQMTNGRIQGAGGWYPLKVVGPNPPPGVLPFLAALLESAPGGRRSPTR